MLNRFFDATIYTAARSLIRVALFVALVSTPLYALGQGGASRALPTSSLSLAAQALGHTPQWVYEKFGRPVLVHRSGCCSFQGFSSNERPSHTVLVHAYDLVAGGRIAFIYDRLANGSTWKVVGIVYDALSSPQRQTMAKFFPLSVKTYARRFTCYENDPYHQVGEDAISQQSVYAVWSAPYGREIYAKYDKDGKLPEKYDPVSGKNMLVIPHHHRGFPLVQWGYFQSLLNIVDLHFATDDDFSIVTRYKHCIR